MTILIYFSLGVAAFRVRPPRLAVVLFLMALLTFVLTVLVSLAKPGL